MRTLSLMAMLAGAAGCASALAAEPPGDASQTLPDSIELLGVIRDFPPDSGHVDFEVEPSATPGARSAQNIAVNLGDDQKPVYVGGGRRIHHEWRDTQGNKIAWCVPPMPGDNPGSMLFHDNGGIDSAESFSQWFRDVPGVNMSRTWSIRLDRQADGTFVFDTDDFHPIDSQLLGNGPDEHNFYFTYEIACTFTAEPGQFVTFTGDDDCWIFINDRLVIDHGGIVANRRQHFALERLGLSPGQECEMRFFFAERCQPQSQFRLETNIGRLQSATAVSSSAACD